VGLVTRRDFEGFERQILSPAFAIKLGEHARDTFVAKIEKETEDLSVLFPSRRLREGLSFTEAICV
jgi:hypothetical protein